ncbi:hypothetical protein [Polaromonas hydrogenivorans]|uniref:Uncharacterized protein n=1 Tax=Polaromonas hydrogenivorans TaxID=335476 RepID=A0AAU7LWX9_9BURK
MLTAITSGKAGRIQIDGVEHKVSWREVFRRSEDLLTAAIFGRMRYLSETSLNSVMSLLIGKESAEELGHLQRIDFWRNLDGTHSRTRVQPDVLMWFDNALVIVEIKPPFGGDQYLEQWKAQIHAVVNLCAQDGENSPACVHFVGLGRNTLDVKEQSYEHFDTQGVFDLTLHTAEWEALSAAIPRMRVDALAADLAVFDDWLSAMELFGIQSAAYKWPDLLAWASTCDLSLEAIRCLPKMPEIKSPSRLRGAPVSWNHLIAFSAAQPLTLQ